MKLLSLARDLKRRKARERQQLFVAEGVRAVEELLSSGLRIEGILMAPQLADAPRGAGLRSRIEDRDVASADISELEFRSAAETESPQGVLAIAEIPAFSFDSIETGNQLRLLVLDAVQDPGNLGTILRSSAAFGVTATIALPGTVDLWNPKVVRAAMGAHFRQPAFHSTPDALFAFLDREQCELWAADADGEDVAGLSVPARLAIAVGNEGAGISGTLRDRAARTVSIAIEEGVESLNVAVATGILLHRLRK